MWGDFLDAKLAEKFVGVSKMGNYEAADGKALIVSDFAYRIYWLLSKYLFVNENGAYDEG